MRGFFGGKGYKKCLIYSLNCGLNYLLNIHMEDTFGHHLLQQSILVIFIAKYIYFLLLLSHYYIFLIFIL